jgi:hypothetical protein
MPFSLSLFVIESEAKKSSPAVADVRKGWTGLPHRLRLHAMTDAIQFTLI